MLYQELFCYLLKTLLESVNTSADVNKLLLTGEEGVALRADFNVDIAALGGSGLVGCAASALDGYFVIFGMYSSFHF